MVIALKAATIVLLNHNPVKVISIARGIKVNEVVALSLVSAAQHEGNRINICG
ncbi:hypothetical protein [Leptolyngbya sp. FACHB-711]|uniref:hypothetical protein n=1 Tax=Leptolyngbya sp. FACHB-711 TaxID=2692813 RepID=UPI001682668F|nr:hypothetical protein [Leptolyngbya sp. FACHB-711]